MNIPVVAGYHDLRPIGRGGLGDVYRASSEATGAIVAIKLLRDVADSSLAWHRTRRELAALASLHGHTNVIAPIDLLESADGPVLVMEYAPGGSLADALDGSRRLSVDEVVFVGRQTASALVSTHARGIVHRDVKPHNLLIDAAGRVKLCDFGIAALTRDDEYRTGTNAVSSRYASPEELEHDLPVGPATDVYSLGATMLHLARGVTLTLRDRLVGWTPPPVDDPGLAALDRVVARCLQPATATRPSAQGLLDALDGVALGSGSARVTALRLRPSAPPRLDPRETDPEATTLHRGRLPVPEAAEPVAARRWRPTRRAWVIAAGVAPAIVAIAGVTVLGAGSSAPSAVPVTAPAGAVTRDLSRLDWSAGAIGDCLVAASATGELRVTDCGEAHDVQRIGAGRLASPDQSSEFDVGRVEAEVTAICDDAFRRFVGGDPEASTLGRAHTRPSSGSWADGDRRYECFVAVDGARLVGDAHSTGW